jgi:hypothetical protein
MTSTTVCFVQAQCNQRLLLPSAVGGVTFERNRASARLHAPALLARRAPAAEARGVRWREHMSDMCEERFSTWHAWTVRDDELCAMLSPKTGFVDDKRPGLSKTARMCSVRKGSGYG